MSRGRIRRARRRATQKRRIHIAVSLLILTIVPLIAVLAGGFFTVGAVLANLPKLKTMGEIQNWQTTKIYASDGTLLTNLYYEQDRIVIPLSDIPKHMQSAVIAIEDERYYKHEGYDPAAIARAFFTNLESGAIVEGASTITQQLVKNTMITSEKTLDRKIKEAALAYQLEQKYSKDQILEKYLNTIYFGHSWYGVETASLNYFGKHARDITLPEAALLAGIIKSPNNYSPHTHPNEAKARRDLVIRQMAQLKYISDAEAKQAIATPLQVRPLYKPVTVAPYFVEYVKQELIKKYGENVVFKGGLRVYTTIDLKMQQYAEQAAWSTLNLATDPSAAIVAVDPHKGHIKVMVGGRDFGKKKYNLATQGKRQPGSAFKTFVFAAAIENGISPYRTYLSSPAVIPIEGSEPWKVNNYVEGSGGPPMNIREALVRSVNTVYARLIMDVGAKKVAELAMKMGITSQVNPNPAIALGGLTNGASVLDMASAYGTLATGGKHYKPVAITKVTDSAGKVLYEHKPEPEDVINEATAYIVTDVLQDVIRRGTGTRAGIGRPAAGKTGTAQEYRDAWFCGYTPDLSTAVWVGYPQGQVPMKRVHGIRVSGGSFPAQIWSKFMSKALKGKPATSFSKPKGGIVNVAVCTESGLLANKYCPEVKRRPFFSKKKPDKKCQLHAKPSIIEIPTLVGWRERDALQKLDKLHFGHAVVYRVDEYAARGVVLEQTPSGGERARQGAVVQLVVSAGGANLTIKVPNLVGLSEKQAMYQLSTLGLNGVSITAMPYIPGRGKRNKVMHQSPSPGSDVQYGQTVTLYVNRRD